ncbi:MAG: feruloyl-CoA synthase [Rhodospirillales bacterium]|nr:feruloyl-CoA synthase [Rhodospirillales bacterium]
MTDPTTAYWTERADYDLTQTVIDRKADGTLTLTSPYPLGRYPERLTEPLLHWARVAGTRAFMAERGPDGAWRALSYAQALNDARAIGQALLDRGLGPERPIAILSGNDLDHARLALAAMHVGVPFVPISPAYSLLSAKFTRLHHILDLIRPGLIYVAQGAPYAKAIEACAPAGCEIVVGDAAPGPLTQATAFSRLAAVRPGPPVDAAYAGVGATTIAKFLFTSGSSGVPKGVITTHGMLAANQRMARLAFAQALDRPPLLVDWLPWNHTFGGSFNFGLTLFNGGTLYIDAGKPLPDRIGETVRNLKALSPTLYFNVPAGFEALIRFFKEDADLRRTFFKDLQVMFYAGASLLEPVWNELRALSLAETGRPIPMLTSLGATETAPLATFSSAKVDRAGNVGLPAPGMTMKLVPIEGRLEGRLHGPTITPGYWRQPELTQAAFDEDGFYKLGDAVRFADPADASRGLAFDGRIAEDFKLATGTWVSVHAVRAQFIAAFKPLVMDVVIAGHDRDDLRVLAFPNIEACRALAADLGHNATPALILAHPKVRQAFQGHLEALNRQATGASNRIVALLVEEQPLSIDHGEVTDKGSVNQRAVRENRADRVRELYAEPPLARLLLVDKGA